MLTLAQVNEINAAPTLEAAAEMMGVAAEITHWGGGMWWVRIDIPDTAMYALLGWIDPADDDDRPHHARHLTDAEWRTELVDEDSPYATLDFAVVRTSTDEMTAGMVAAWGIYREDVLPGQEYPDTLYGGERRLIHANWHSTITAVCRHACSATDWDLV
jgi:hypothetical protein